MDVTELLGSLRWLDSAGEASVDGDELTMHGGAGTDWFNDPDTGVCVAAAPALCVELVGDFQLSARVSVRFASEFDAGVVLLHQSGDDYAKLCFERSPSGENTLVSVVTRRYSDDANGPVLAADTVMLRVSKYREVIAFHWSADGRVWSLLRYFRLRDPGRSMSIGFLAQSPRGDGCTATFSDIRYRAGHPEDIRDGT